MTLADIEGPGRIRHIWMTFPPSTPERMRSVLLDVFYDGQEFPSVSTPCLDFFGLPHGRPVAYHSAMTSVAEARGFNAYYPMPFRKRLRMVLTNSSSAAVMFYFQIDYTLEPLPADSGYLHVTFRRENPTTLKKDFAIASGLKGPGRFLGCVVGIRVLHDAMSWYGEGEVKIYRDGDSDNPTICGTGLEDYAGSAWGMGQHTAPYSGVPVYVLSPEKRDGLLGPVPDFVSFYRWHVPDPIIFREQLRVTIQQIGALAVARGQEAQIDALSKQYTLAGTGWAKDIKGPPFSAITLAERRDDYCATAFVYCQIPQSVPRIDAALGAADIARRPFEETPPW